MANIQTEQDQRQVKRIDALPDDVLLDIFESYMEMYPFYIARPHTEAWQALVHVCRQWRSLVLASPRRLNLQLYCTPTSPAKDKLDVWPPLPIIVEGNMALSPVTENIVAALRQNNRVRRVELHIVGWKQSEEVLGAMLVPFPELTRMRLFMSGNGPSVIPSLFLGGSAPPHLQYLDLIGLPFFGLPRMLFSATHLICLALFLPDSDCIKPKAVIALLSVLSNLRRFTLGFLSTESIINAPEIQTPRTRSILPAINKFRFKGDLHYLEELVSHIDMPQLDGFHAVFFPDMGLDFPRLAQYVNRIPKFRACDESRAHVEFFDGAASVALRERTGLNSESSDELLVEILSREPDWQLSFVVQVCAYLRQPLSTVEDLYIQHRYMELDWDDGSIEIEDAFWCMLLRQFTAVKNLYISKESAPGIAAALPRLQDLTPEEEAQVTVKEEGGAAHELPNLQNIFVEGTVPPLGLFNDNAGEFLVARQLSGRPITISVWDKDSDKVSVLESISRTRLLAP